MESDPPEGEVQKVACLLRATHGSALRVVTADISAQEISDHQTDERGHAPEFCNLTAWNHTISHKCSEVWENGKMTNRCSQVVLMYSWWEGNQWFKEGTLVKTWDECRISAAFLSLEFPSLCSSLAGFSPLLCLGGPPAALCLSSVHGFFSLCKEKQWIPFKLKPIKKTILEKEPQTSLPQYSQRQ